ncbi:hypothetical protein C922_03988 [Plasmodium inui San Antonio 1]|uniref:Uncharacterized protein n=1 Tax=Plasmodium inui San Antonio 1 TaxID=1237626 RepID=W7A244_9APIC|nr:hypothetical protein C922_03988 [Plasmodium inui San Antonio 1]EUD65740.1 hypothetical protein C922_03988 [Plasmodium inui San Antonio 1]
MFNERNSIHSVQHQHRRDQECFQGNIVYRNDEFNGETYTALIRRQRSVWHNSVSKQHARVGQYGQDSWFDEFIQHYQKKTANYVIHETRNKRSTPECHKAKHKVDMHQSSVLRKRAINTELAIPCFKAENMGTSPYMRDMDRIFLDCPKKKETIQYTTGGFKRDLYEAIDRESHKDAHDEDNDVVKEDDLPGRNIPRRHERYIGTDTHTTPLNGFDRRKIS